MQVFQRFLADESGAVSVDWVVLTSTSVALVILGMTFLGTPLFDLANDIKVWMDNYHAMVSNR